MSVTPRWHTGQCMPGPHVSSLHAGEDCTPRRVIAVTDGRHGDFVMCRTIVITTTEQAEAMLEHLDKCAQSARVDNYATERARPIKWMTCTCCGESYLGRQWYNQDCGYGLGDCCVDYCHAPREGESSCYGVAGIHYLIPQQERDNPPIVVDRGSPLYGLDERLRIEDDGYVFWKGLEIEHYSHGALHATEENKAAARDLIRCCELLESRGETVSFSAIFRLL